MDTYDFESKHRYRARRESAIDRTCSAGKFRDRKVAYLDTGEALDTLAYLRRGYRPCNLWAINRNPAEVAQLTKTIRAAGFSGVNTVGLDFEDALTRRVPDVNILDFDGMSCLHGNLVDMLNRIVRTRPNAVYGITILAGRESGKDRFLYGEKTSSQRAELFAELFASDEDDFLKIRDRRVAIEKRAQKLNATTSFGTLVCMSHRARLMDLLSSVFAYSEDKAELRTCLHHMLSMEWDVYRSTSGQPMLWAVAKIEPHHEINGDAAWRLYEAVDQATMPLCQSRHIMRRLSHETPMRGQKSNLIATMVEIPMASANTYLRNRIR